MSNKLNSMMKRLLPGAAICVATAASPTFADYTLNAPASFNGTSAVSFYAGPTLAGDGSIRYGTTSADNAHSAGVVFSEPVTGSIPTALASLNHTDLHEPLAGLTLPGEPLYGTTEHGVTYGDVFSEAITNGTPMMLAKFNGSYGGQRGSDLNLSGNTLHGTTEFGVSAGGGEIFSLPTTGAPIVPAPFNGVDAKTPLAGLIIHDNGNLYGTTPEDDDTYDDSIFYVLIATELGLLAILAAGGISLLIRQRRQMKNCNLGSPA